MELVERAAARGVTMLALTDHDTVQGIREAKNAAAQHGIQLISGVEISAQWNGKSVHIVGLNFDEKFQPMLDFLKKQQALRQQRAEQIGERLANAGIPNAFENAQKYTAGEVTRAHYARYLIDIGKAKDMKQAFKRYLGVGKAGYVKTQWCEMADAVAIIRQAGGVAVFAHPLRYNFSRNQIRRIASDFACCGGGAMEIAGCNQNSEQRQFLHQLALQEGLQASVGSDFHFISAWCDLGRDLALQEGAKPVWEHFTSATKGTSNDKTTSRA